MRLLGIKTYRVEGDPISLLRARFRDGGRPWDSQKTEKHQWMNCLEEQHGNEPLFTGPLMMNVIFRFKIPKIHSKHAEELIDTHHFYTPDVDNLIKFVLDCGRGVIYKDDRIVSEVHAIKLYALEPCTEITIIPFLAGTKISPEDDDCTLQE